MSTNAGGLPARPDMTMDKSHTTCPFESLRDVLAFDPRDWAQGENDAWIWGIIHGWTDVLGQDGKPDLTALEEVAVEHHWKTYTLVRIKKLHEDFVRAEKTFKAAKELVATMDYVLGEDWRDETLNVGDEGDELNAAWDQLIEALEEDLP